MLRSFARMKTSERVSANHPGVISGGANNIQSSSKVACGGCSWAVSHLIQWEVHTSQSACWFKKIYIWTVQLTLALAVSLIRLVTVMTWRSEQPKNSQADEMLDSNRSLHARQLNCLKKSLLLFYWSDQNTNSQNLKVNIAAGLMPWMQKRSRSAKINQTILLLNLVKHATLQINSH